MTDAIAIHGYDIIDLVSQHPDGIRLSQLMEVVDERNEGRSSSTFYLSATFAKG
jgi:hypothetical protein